jgi:dihydropteroate synthase
MAIVNRTRDSFYDGGRTFAFERALEAALAAIAEGADWVDIGGVPFSPLAENVDEAQEIDRVVPLVTALRPQTDAIISVDTFRPDVARAAVAAGADAINDTSGLHDLAMADVAAESGSTLIVTHSVAAPRTWHSRPMYEDVVAEVRSFLLDRVHAALARGVSHDKIIIDPGHDLNKNTVDSLRLTRRLADITALGYPVLASVSNKDFVSETLGRPVNDVREGTLATIVYCVLQGARILRVHDARSTATAVHMLSGILGWSQPTGTRHNMD